MSSISFYPFYLIERFWSKVLICQHGMICKDCCWLWKGCTIRGYGMFRIPKPYRQGKSENERANRVCWRIIYGPISESLHVLHNCPPGDNPTCVNYWHLWTGTDLENKQVPYTKIGTHMGKATDFVNILRHMLAENGLLLRNSSLRIFCQYSKQR